MLDPTLDWTREARGAPLASMADVAAWMGGKKRGRLAIYRPPDGRYQEAADVVARMAFQAQAPFFKKGNGQRLLIVLDEASGALPSRGTLSPAVQGLIERGRHYGVDLVAITQRPSQVHANMRGNSALRVYLPVFDHGDVATIKKEIGPAADRLATLPPYTALVQNAGTVTELPVPRPK